MAPSIRGFGQDDRMNAVNAGAVTLRVVIEKFALKQPFRITGHTMMDTDVVTVTLEKGGHIGRGEASGVYYRQDDDASGVVTQIEAVRATQWTAPCGIWRRS
jgi:hypothetical protein